MARKYYILSLWQSGIPRSWSSSNRCCTYAKIGPACQIHSFTSQYLDIRNRQPNRPLLQCAARSTFSHTHLTQRTKRALPQDSSLVRHQNRSENLEALGSRVFNKIHARQTSLGAPQKAASAVQGKSEYSTNLCVPCINHWKRRR